MAQNKFSTLQLISMNRHDRRRFGKELGVKIPGVPNGSNVTVKANGAVDISRVKKNAIPDSVINVK